MEAESAFPGTFSDFEAERLMSGVELHQIPTHKFEDLGTADIDVDCALSYVVLQHHILNVIFERSGGSMIIRNTYATHTNQQVVARETLKQ
jgi:hypothetical protein